jgi:hypothetical protein
MRPPLTCFRRVYASVSSLVFVGVSFCQSPTVTTQPASKAVLAGETAVLTVVATGAIPLAYQWFEGTAGDITAPIASGTDSSLFLPALNNAKFVWVKVSNTAGSANSAAVCVLPWSQRTTGLAQANLNGASYANGRYFVFPPEGGATSADGVNWTTFGSARFGLRQGSRVAYGKGLYVAGGGSTAQAIYVSSDGQLWTNRTSGQNTVIARVIFNGTRFVAVGESGGISTSEDGLTWSPRYASSTLSGLVYGNGTHVAHGPVGSMVTSVDGLTWTAVTPPNGLQVGGATFGRGRFLAFAAGSTQREIWTSSNGADWTIVANPVFPTLPSNQVISPSDVEYGGGVFVGFFGPHVFLSEDGVVWSTTPNFFAQQTIYPASIGYGNGRFLFAGQSGVVLQTMSIAGAAAISSQTNSSLLLPGATTTLNVSATGAALMYQWYRGTSGDTSQLIAGAAAASYSTPALTENQSYWVRVTNTTSAVDSATIDVGVATPPAFAAYQSRDIEVLAGGPATFSVSVMGGPVPLLQWYEGTPGDVSRPVGGATSSSLTVTAGGAVKKFWLRATNLVGSVNSAEFRYTPWNFISVAPALSNVRKIGGTLVGVGADSVLTSSDGRQWTKTATISNSILKDIAQGLGLYVAVGDRGFFTSPDLQTWTQRNLPASPGYNGATSLARGNGVFVAVGYGTYVSVNGIDWTAISHVGGASLASIVFDGTGFVGVGGKSSGEGVVLTSNDGATWIESPVNAPAVIDKIDFVGGKYLATSSAANFVVVSNNAASWTRTDFSAGLTDRFRSVAFAFGHYLIGTEGDRYLTSSDAVYWSATMGPEGMSTRTLFATDGELFGIGSSGTVFASADGWNWSPLSALPDGSGYHKVEYIEARYLAEGGNSNYQYYSSDGGRWQVGSSFIPSTGPGRITYGVDRFVMLARDGVLVSRDAQHWVKRAIPGATFTEVRAAGNRVFVLAGTQIASSSDGDTWTIPPASLPGTINALAFGNGIYVGAGSTLIRSTSGTAWTSQSIPPGKFFTDVTFANGIFVAVGTEIIMTSADGQNWVDRTPSPIGNLSLYAIEYCGDRFLAATTNGLAYSLDGVNWQFSPSIGPNIYDLEIANGRAFGVGNGIWHRAIDGLTTSVIAISPSPQVLSGGSATLHVDAVGPGLTYQWYAGTTGDTSTAITGASGATFTTAALTTSQCFWVRASGSAGMVDSASVRVIVSGPPVILAQPFPSEIYKGFYGEGPAVVRVDAEGAPPLAYQWFAGRTGDTLHPVVGAEAATLILPKPALSGRYWARVSNAHGSVNSADAMVTVWDDLLLTGAGYTSFGTSGFAAGQNRYIVNGRRFAPLPIAGVSLASTDAQAWTLSSTPQLGVTVYGNNRFVAAAGPLYWSVDGTSWTPTTVDGAPARFVDVFFEGGRFFAVGGDATLATSSDGMTWSAQVLGTQRLYAVAAGNNCWIATGAAGAVFRSTDGSSWQPIANLPNITLRAAAYGAGNFVVLSEDTRVLRSVDGTTWSTEATAVVNGPSPRLAVPFTLPVINRLAYVAGRFFATPGGGFFGYISYDGIVWWDGPPVFGTIVNNGGYVGVNQTVVGTVSGTTVGFSGGSSGKLYRSRVEAAVPIITTQPVAQTANAGQAVSFSVEATSNSAVSYQWRRNGTPIIGAANATLTIPNPQLGDAGSYTVVITNTHGSVESVAVALTVLSTLPRGLVSSVVQATTSAVALRGAFTIEGSVSKQILVRAVGPTLANFGVAGFVADPALSIFSAATGIEVANNNDWGQASNAAQIALKASEVGAYPLNTGSKDAAVLGIFSPGTYRVVVGTADSAGTANLEIYDADANPRMVYLATVANVPVTGTFVQGFDVRAPPAGRSYLIRALGPSTGLSNAVTDPRVAIFLGTTQLAFNDDWAGDTTLATIMANVGAMPILAASKDAAIVFVPPAGGAYTINVAAAGAAGGAALLEIFEVDLQRSTTIPVTIVAMPTSVAVNLGQSASFGVVTTGRPTPTFQWSKDGNMIGGATDSKMSVDQTQTADTGVYSVLITNGGTPILAMATLTVTPNHSADTNQDNRISLLELTRAIELYNTRNGAARTGCYRVDPAGEDGFAADSSRSAASAANLTRYHSADTRGSGAGAPRDGALDLLELTRVIELYNTRSGPTRTGQYHVQLGTEDGFAPGP